MVGMGCAGGWKVLRACRREIATNGSANPLGAQMTLSPIMRGYTVTTCLVCALPTRMGGRALVAARVLPKVLCGCGLGVVR